MQGIKKTADMLPPPPATLGGLQLCGEEKQKNVVALLTGKITVKFELSLIGLMLILNFDMVICRVA